MKCQSVSQKTTDSRQSCNSSILLWKLSITQCLLGIRGFVGLKLTQGQIMGRAGNRGERKTTTEGEEAGRNDREEKKHTALFSFSPRLRRRFPLAPISWPPHDLPQGLRGWALPSTWGTCLPTRHGLQSCAVFELRRISHEHYSFLGFDWSITLRL